MLVATLSHATCNIYSPKGFGALIHENATHIVFFIVYEIHFLLILSKCSIRSKITCQNMQGLRHSVWAIDNFVYMKTSSKWRPGPILENLYAPQNFVPAFLSTVVWSLKSQFPWKRTNRASIRSNQLWRRLQCVKEFCIRSRTAAPKLRSEWFTCYEAKGNLR